MTEAEWISSEDPRAMLEWVAAQPGDRATRSNRTDTYVISDRKLRLFVLACYPADHHFGAWARELERAKGKRSGEYWTELEAARYCCGAKIGQHHLCRLTPEIKSLRANILRDICGNPFHRWIEKKWEFTGHTRAATDWYFDPAWLTPTVIALAKASYDECLQNGTLDPDRLLVLSDALESAGCDNAEILNHLRGLERCIRCGGTGTVYTGFRDTMGPTRWCDGMQGAMPGPVCGNTGWIPLRGPHVRGCWVLDLLLGKE
jgi:hypothetical protein